MKNIVFLCLFLFILAGSTAFGSTAITVTPADSGKTITVRRGEIVRVELPSHGGTGFLWQADPFDRAHLELLTTESGNEHPNKMSGETVISLWDFKAIQAGETTLTMRLYRPWEGKEKAAETFSVIIKILE